MAAASADGAGTVPVTSGFLACAFLASGLGRGKGMRWGAAYARFGSALGLSALGQRRRGGTTANSAAIARVRPVARALLGSIRVLRLAPRSPGVPAII